jgi:hypothetical protein
MKIPSFQASVWRSLPLETKNKARDIFIEYVKTQNATITYVADLKADFELNPNHKEIIKILKKTRGRDNTAINSLEELTPKERKMYEKRKSILEQRWVTKAQYKIIMSLYSGKRPEDIGDIKTPDEDNDEEIDEV